VSSPLRRLFSLALAALAASSALAGGSQGIAADGASSHTGTIAASGKATVAPAPLAARGGRVAVKISCAAKGADCVGSVRVRSHGKVAVGGKRRQVVVAGPLRYRVVAGKAKAFSLKLSKDGKSALAQAQGFEVDVELRAEGARKPRVQTVKLSVG